MSTEPDKDDVPPVEVVDPSVPINPRRKRPRQEPSRNKLTNDIGSALSFVWKGLTAEDPEKFLKDGLGGDEKK